MKGPTVFARPSSEAFVYVATGQKIGNVIVTMD
jgi:hypothetical protein